MPTSRPSGRCTVPAESVASTCSRSLICCAVSTDSPEIGRFLRYHLVIKVFGDGASVDQATDRVFSEMAGIGYTAAHQKYGVAQALHDAFLIQRSAQLDAVTPETLRIVTSSSQLLIRRAAATLSQTLMRMGIIECAFDYQTKRGSKPVVDLSSVRGWPVRMA